MAKGGGGNWKRVQRWGYFFIAPFAAAYCVFILWPTLYTVLLSFTSLKGLDAEIKITGVQNFTRLFKDKQFLQSIANTFIISGCTLVPQIFVALVLSLWLSDTRLNLRGRSVFRAIIFLPNLLTMATVAVLFKNFFTYPSGLLNQLVYNMGIRQTVMQDGQTVVKAYDLFRSVAFSRGLSSFIYWWMFYGSTNIIFMAGITSINPAFFEAAEVDGATGMQTAWHITLPLLRPIMLYVFFTTMIGGMQAFDMPFLLTASSSSRFGGGPNNMTRTMALYVYQVAFIGNNDKAYGAAVSMGMFVLTIILALIIFFFLQDRSDLKRVRG